jgi:hypothetical protein
MLKGNLSTRNAAGHGTSRSRAWVAPGERGGWGHPPRKKVNGTRGSRDGR